MELLTIMGFILYRFDHLVFVSHPFDIQIEI